MSPFMAEHVPLSEGPISFEHLVLHRTTYQDLNQLHITTTIFCHKTLPHLHPTPIPPSSPSAHCFLSFLTISIPHTQQLDKQTNKQTFSTFLISLKLAFYVISWLVSLLVKGLFQYHNGYS